MKSFALIFISHITLTKSNIKQHECMDLGKLDLRFAND